MEHIAELSHRELLNATKDLRKQEHGVLVDLLVYLGEVDERQSFRDGGYPSLYAFLTEELRYSEGAAHRRIQVARSIRKFVGLFEALKDERLSFTTAYEIGRVATLENIDRLIKECAGRSKVDVLRIIALLGYGDTEPRAKKEQVMVLPKEVRQTDNLDLPFGDGESVEDLESRLNPHLAVEVSSGEEESEEVRYQISLEVDEEFMQLFQKVKTVSRGRRMEGAL